MTLMLRTLVLAALTLVLVPDASGQTPGVLRVKVSLVDASAKVSPVSRHMLLISENPAAAAPRVLVTKLDGTAEIRLRPGNYTVESDQPVAFQGKTYEWMQIVEMAAGRDTTLELTSTNANVEAVTGTAAAESGKPLESDPSFLLQQWQDSVVALWTPTTHASGFVVDASGLIATNQRSVGRAAAVEVQLSPTVKVGATVLTADPARDVAVLWVDPAVLASVRPVPLSCSEAPAAPVEEGDEIFTIGVPFRQQKGLSAGSITGLDPRALASDLVLARGSAGGPVFAARGELVGMTSVRDEDDRTGRGNSRVVRRVEVCAVVAAAREAMKTAARPAATPLPVEPAQPSSVASLKQAAERRAGSPTAYRLSASTFDVSFITPVLVYGAQIQAERATGRTSSRDTRGPDPEQERIRPLRDFANWSGYVQDFPPVLMVRVTPKLAEGFWTRVGRVAASTQGVSIPPIKRFASGFSRLRAFCGDKEVTPIHPFMLEQRVSETDAIYEGFYVFDPSALGPHCGAVKLVLFSEKEPEKGDTRIVDPGIVEQFWSDFADYRATR